MFLTAAILSCAMIACDKDEEGVDLAPGAAITDARANLGMSVNGESTVQLLALMNITATDVDRVQMALSNFTIHGIVEAPTTMTVPDIKTFGLDTLIQLSYYGPISMPDVEALGYNVIGAVNGQVEVSKSSGNHTFSLNLDADIHRNDSPVPIPLVMTIKSGI